MTLPSRFELGIRIGGRGEVAVRARVGVWLRVRAEVGLSFVGVGVRDGAEAGFELKRPEI